MYSLVSPMNMCPLRARRFGRRRSNTALGRIPALYDGDEVLTDFGLRSCSILRENTGRANGPCRDPVPRRCASGMTLHLLADRASGRDPFGGPAKHSFVSPRRAARPPKSTDSLKAEFRTNPQRILFRQIGRSVSELGRAGDDTGFCWRPTGINWSIGRGLLPGWMTSSGIGPNPCATALRSAAAIRED